MRSNPLLIMVSDDRNILGKQKSFLLKQILIIVRKYCSPVLGICLFKTYPYFRTCCLSKKFNIRKGFIHS